jgi:hypothetical protein
MVTVGDFREQATGFIENHIMGSQLLIGLQWWHYAIASVFVLGIGYFIINGKHKD